MGPRLSSKIAGVREELSLVQIRDRDRIFLVLEVKETFPTIRAQEVKKGAMST